MPDDTLGRRARQAQQTRSEILTAARRLFAERGYARTTVREIAEAAGVSAQTVYDSVGSKQAIVAGLNDLIDTEASIAHIVREAFASNDPTAIAATQARVTRAILERCGDILHALLTGAASEPELAAVLAEGDRRHFQGAQRVVEALRKQKALRHELDPTTAAEELAAASDIRAAVMLRDTYAWPYERIEAWIARLSRQLLLGVDETSRGH